MQYSRVQYNFIQKKLYIYIITCVYFKLYSSSSTCVNMQSKDYKYKK